jgi:CRP/FNR family transcriptional regulator
MGDVLGLTIETVSRQLSLLKADGIINLPDRRTVAIQNRARLQDLSAAA